MKSALSLTVALLLCTPLLVRAQSQSTSQVNVMIAGFASVSAAQESISLAAPSDDALVVEDVVTYGTNRSDQVVRVHVEGDLTGWEIRIEPDVSGSRLLGKAVTGRVGEASMLTFQEAGSQPFVVDITGAGVELPVRYTAVALSDEAEEARAFRIYYTIE